MTLGFQGISIDLSGAYQCKLYNRFTKQWQTVHADFSKTSLQNIMGLSLPVIALHTLLDYKKILGRTVDLIDIEQIEKF